VGLVVVELELQVSRLVVPELVDKEILVGLVFNKVKLVLVEVVVELVQLVKLVQMIQAETVVLGVLIQFQRQVAIFVMPAVVEALVMPQEML
jgi:hypothetical protein